MGISSHLNCCRRGPLVKSIILSQDNKKDRQSKIELDKENKNENLEEQKETEERNDININSSNEITFKAKGSSIYTNGSLLVGESKCVFNNNPFVPNYSKNNNYNLNMNEQQDEFNTLFEQLKE